MDYRPSNKQPFLTDLSPEGNKIHKNVLEILWGRIPEKNNPSENKGCVTDIVTSGFYNKDELNNAL